MAFLLNCALIYVAIVYGLIPLLAVVFAIIMFIGGSIARLYYFIEDYLTKEHKND